MNTVEENNILLDNFMGSKGEYISHKDIWGGEVWGSYKPNTYNSNWNLLMEVVEKIETVTDINSNGCFMVLESIGFNAKFIFDDGTRILKDSKGETKIEAIYNACVEFIKWYNEQQISAKEVKEQ